MEKNRSLLWSMFLSFSCALVISVSGIVYTGMSTARNNEEMQKQQIESDRQWCELLTTLDTAYSSAPPQTELGKRIANSINILRKNFEC